MAIDDKEMQELADQATSGPWSADRYTEIDPDGAYDLARVLAPDPDEPNTTSLGVVHEGIMIPDAAFIANTRQWVPDAIRRIEAVREACQSRVDKAADRRLFNGDPMPVYISAKAILRILDGDK